jgi:AAA+ superfamily predicted ATPase
LDDFVASPIVEKQVKYLIESYKKWLPLPKTILLYGWHNLWKTFTANLLASELNRKMYHIKSYDIYTWWYSDPNEMLDAIFTWAIKQKEPCIIFLDEMESFNVEGGGWAYQKLVENTIRHHISKLKESNLDVVVIWAVADKSKIDWNLLKHDVFAKQILFSPLPRDKAEELMRKTLSKKWVKLGKNCDLEWFFKNDKKDGRYTHDYIKWFIDILLSLHEWEKNIVLSSSDFEQAKQIIVDTEHAMWSGIGYVN